jgi:hypothetical protein
MTAIESTAHVEGIVHPVLAQDDSPLASSPLAASRKAVQDLLSNTGFVDVAGRSSRNFETYLNREPFEVEVGDLKPGMLTDLVAWVASEISGGPDRALQMQAQVDPERAVKLLA